MSDAIGPRTETFRSLVVLCRSRTQAREGRPAIGSFSYDTATDSVRLSWPASDGRLSNFIAAAQHTLSDLDQRNGSVTLGFNPLVSAHPLGGAVLGKACTLSGRVKGQRSLYAVDGALIEGSTGLANPSFTIAALAERCMDRIVPRLHDRDRDDE